MTTEYETPEEYMGESKGARVVYVRETSKELNHIVLGCASVLALMTLGIGGWGIATLVSTREELAGMRTELRSLNDVRTEMRSLNERMSRLEQQQRTR